MAYLTKASPSTEMGEGRDNRGLDMARHGSGMATDSADQEALSFKLNIAPSLSSVGTSAACHTGTAQNTKEQGHQNLSTLLY